MKMNFSDYQRTGLLKRTSCGILVFTFLFFFSGIKSHAQFFDEISNPKVTVKIEHPPGLGLKINKIAFNTATGNCSSQIITSLISDFVNSNVEVIDRENLNLILAEHDFNFSGYVDQSKAVAIGKIIGPSALITVKVLRCETKRDNLHQKEQKYDSKTKRNIEVVAYTARTRVFLKVSIQTVDLTTGRIFTALILDYSPSKENKSYDGKAEMPAEFDVQEIAFQALVADVHRMFLPWTENTQLYYFDDKAGNLKQAFQALQSGNQDLAFSLSQQNLETCKRSIEIKEKTLAHAYYNLGVSYMIRNEFDQAIENFLETQKIRPGTIVTDAIEKCQRAKELAIAMLKVEEKASINAEKIQTEEAQAIRAEVENTIVNSDIIELTKKKIPNSIILQKIKNSKCKFDTSPDALITLTNAGVSEAVIMLMMEKK